MKTLLALLSAAVAAPSVLAGVVIPPPNDPLSLRIELEEGLWPADIVRSADECLRSLPATACSDEAARVRPLAATAASALGSRDVSLHRSAFSDPRLLPEHRDDLHRAAIGDARAAVRIANTFAHGAEAPAAERYRYQGWMRYAVELGDAAASYQLALHYRSADEPQLAAVYETRATRLGYVPPLALDHNRK